MKIADKINLFNAYIESACEANRLCGVTDEVTLPNFEFMSETLVLAGMGGEVDSPSPGQVKSIQMEIPFSNISKESLRLAAEDNKTLILRAAQQQIDTETLGSSNVGRVITVKGMTKAINFGKLKKGGYGKPSITKELIYYQDMLDGEVVTEVDKFHGKCIVNGVNLMQDVDELI